MYVSFGFVFGAFLIRQTLERLGADPCRPQKFSDRVWVAAGRAYLSTQQLWAHSRVLNFRTRSQDVTVGLPRRDDFKLCGRLTRAFHGGGVAQIPTIAP